MRKLLQKALEALAYADAGEMLPFEDKCRVLEVDPPEDYPRYVFGRPWRQRSKVALNLGRHVDPATVDYASAAARQLDADLILLRHPAGAAPEDVDPLLARLNASRTPYQLEDLSGGWADSVRRFLKRHREVSLVVLNPGDLNDPSLASRADAKRKSAFPARSSVVGDRGIPANQGC